VNENERAQYIFVLALTKKIELNRDGIDVSLNELFLYLEKFYFKFRKRSVKSLNKFLYEDNKDEIVEFLFSEAIINPKQL